jgi:hypothetical protein
VSDPVRKSAVDKLDRILPPLRFGGTEDLIGLGQFILNVMKAPDPNPEMNAEVIAVAVIEAFNLIEEADTI